MDYETYVASGAERFDCRLEELSERRCPACISDAADLLEVAGRKARFRCRGCGLAQTELFAEFGLMAAWYNATIREPAVIEYSTFQLLWPDAKGCFPDEGKSPGTSTQPLL